MPKRNGAAVQLPRNVGPSDAQLEQKTEVLSDTLADDFDYLIKKQKKIRSYLAPITKHSSKRRVKNENEEAVNSIDEAFLEKLKKIDNLARLTETRLRRVRDDMNERNARMVERMELSKSAIIREVVQSRRTKVNWFGPNMIVTPLDESISERQLLLTDNSDDLLELERALNEPMDVC
jgi:hypothetical protein